MIACLFDILLSLQDYCFLNSLLFAILIIICTAAPAARRDVIAGTRVLVQFLRGRNIILSRYMHNYAVHSIYK